AYHGLITAFAWRAKRLGRTTTLLAPAPRHRFAVLVAAHDEQALIGATIDSLRQVDYPRSLVDVHVVADNCTDATVTIARAHGAEVHEHVAPGAGGKGPALSWLLGRLLESGEEYDAFVLVDADTTMSRNFLQVMDSKLRGGAQAVQSYYAARHDE